MVRIRGQPLVSPRATIVRARRREYIVVFKDALHENVDKSPPLSIVLLLRRHEDPVRFAIAVEAEGDFCPHPEFIKPFFSSKLFENVISIVH